MNVPSYWINTPFESYDIFEILRNGDEKTLKQALKTAQLALNVPYDDYTLLEYLAFEGGHPEIAQHLIEAGADPNLANEYGETPLQLAVKKGYIAMTNVLIRSGADVNSQDENGNVPLHDCANVEVASLLIKAGAEVNVCNELGETPLHLAAKHGQTEIVQFLLEGGAELNPTTRTGATPLNLAYSFNTSENRNRQVIQMLEERGAWGAD
ncbi:MAG TPA: hypothetical protein DDZ80_14790 [Cyanobacteria bacterium UBA8803]|nr:hypothetical protein [Cyanobacteria bacterium UBA9273]HBL59698.1 hypothetical protein [Cyanobacteria bacterium UBA8803]